MKDKTKIKKTEESKVEPQNPEIEILKNQLARTLADYDNLRKRTDEERVNFIKYASQGIVQNLLPVLDTLENAQVHLKDPGLQIAISQFIDVLKEEGLEEISPKVADEFDPNLMEAIDTVSGTEEQEGKVAELLTSGWKFVDGNVIRHARVKVYKKEE